jgi:hypothetical protein
VIDLHAAGLRVGQELAWARRRTADEAGARALAARHPLCQDFDPDHLRRLLAEAGRA